MFESIYEYNFKASFPTIITAEKKRSYFNEVCFAMFSSNLSMRYGIIYLLGRATHVACPSSTISHQLIKKVSQVLKVRLL